MRQRLAAILAADVAGYSLLMAADPAGTVGSLDAARGVFRARIGAQQGRVIDMAGDSVLAVFDTASGAVNAALEVQQQLAALAATVPEPIRMQFRIGIHLGDVIEKTDGTVYGEGVNIAARLEGLAEPGGITVSYAVRGAVLNRVRAAFDDLGEHLVKNIAHPMRAFRVRSDSGTHGAAESPVPRSSRVEGAVAGPSGNLPAALPPLYGRDTDLAEVRARVIEHRLVTLVGAGGIGKTRLAQAVAHGLQDDFGDGAWMVELASLTDPARIPAAVAQALRIALPGKAPPLDVLADRLKSEALLIVLDNCEHLVDAAGELVDALLRSAPGVHILATSQRPLRLDSEQVIRLGTLAVPVSATIGGAAAHGAVALFVERVAALRTGFVLGEDNVEPIVDICRRLDGVALAIELAAARVPLLGVQGVRDHLGERLRVLTKGARVAAPRHQTLRAALDWSHSLLGAQEQAVFRRLGVFAGSFSLELAQRVAGDATIDRWAVLEHLGELVDKSMVVADPGEVPRYRLLETARAYALEQLVAAGEEAMLRRRHAQSVLAELERQLSSRTMDECAQLWAPQLDNLGRAVEWASGDHGDTLLALALVNSASILMYQMGQYTECARWMLALEPRIDGAAPLAMARFRFGLALGGLHGGLSTERRLELLVHAKAAFEGLGELNWMARTLFVMAYVATVRNDLASAQAYLDEARGVCTEQAPVSLRALFFFMQGLTHRTAERHAEAIDALTQAASLAQAAGDSRAYSNVLNNLGALHFEMGHVEEAVVHHRALLALGRRMHFDSEMMAFTLGWLSHFLAVQGSLDEAQATASEAVPYMRRTIGVRYFCGLFAALPAAQGRLADAARLIGADDAGRARRGETRSRADQRTLDATLGQIAAAHAGTQIDTWRTEGSLLDEDAIIALVLN